MLKLICKHHKPMSGIIRNYTSRMYEPNYLELMKPKYHTYKILNFQIKGYDFPVLENYQKHLHNFAEVLNLEATECWANPPVRYQIQKFKQNSAVTDAEYTVQLYERNIQISDIQSPMYPVLLRLALAAIPEGVTLNVIENSVTEEERRFVPDKDLLDLRLQLDDMGGVSTGKKKFSHK